MCRDREENAADLAFEQSQNSPKRKYIVRYNVEFSKEIEAESEEQAIQIALEIDASRGYSDDQWDQKATSQYEAELA